MSTIYLVWNPSLTECVGFEDYADAYWTANAEWPNGIESGAYQINAWPGVGYTLKRTYEEKL